MQQITDHLPIKKYVLHYGDMITSSEVNPDIEESAEFVRIDELNAFLEKLAQPKIIAKVTRGLMFGSKLNVKEIIDEAINSK